MELQASPSTCTTGLAGFTASVSTTRTAGRKDVIKKVDGFLVEKRTIRFTPTCRPFFPASGASANATTARPLPVQVGLVVRAHEQPPEVHRGVALPLSDDEEEMNSLTSHECQLNQSKSDNKDGPFKQPASSPVSQRLLVRVLFTIQDLG
ncbi:hypothetical protein MRX96_057773 [Rhipicephalus microplus]